MNDLKTLFQQSELKIARLEDEQFNVEQESLNLLEHFYENPTDSESISYAYLDMSNDACLVYMSSVITPSKFYVQNEYSFKLLERLNTDINDFVKKVKTKLSEVKKIEIHKKKMDAEEEFMQSYLKRIEFIRKSFRKETFDVLASKNKPIYCLARQTNENEYNRAKIISFSNENNEAKVKAFFVDYGDFDWISANEILPICEKYFKLLPFQAIECSLNGVVAFDHKELVCLNDWTDYSGDQLWKLTHDEKNFHLELYASAVEINVAKFNQNLSPSHFLSDVANKNYSIKLFRKNLPANMNIANKLVALNCAKFTKSEEEEIFIQNCSNEKNLFSPLTKNFINNFIK
jgi:hypothetical protein